MAIKAKDKNIIFRGAIKGYDPTDSFDQEILENLERGILKAKSVGKLVNVFIREAYDLWSFERLIKKLRITPSLKRALLVDAYFKEERWDT